MMRGATHGYPRLSTPCTLAIILCVGRIQVMNIVYRKVAVMLNEYENFRTETEYNDALIFKTVLPPDATHLILTLDILNLSRDRVQRRTHLQDGPLT